jgi:hypothetical protein
VSATGGAVRRGDVPYNLGKLRAVKLQFTVFQLVIRIDNSYIMTIGLSNIEPVDTAYFPQRENPPVALRRLSSFLERGLPLNRNLPFSTRDSHCQLNYNSSFSTQVKTPVPNRL